MNNHKQKCIYLIILLTLFFSVSNVHSQTGENKLFLHSYVGDSSIFVAISGDVLHKDDAKLPKKWVGYNIYRKVGDELEFTKVTNTPLARINTQEELEILLGEDGKTVEVLAHVENQKELWEKIRQNSKDVLVVSIYSRTFREAMGLLYIDTLVTKGTNYTYQVTKIDIDGVESAPATATMVTFGKVNTSLTAPSVIAAIPSNKTVTITWDESLETEDVYSYVVLRSQNETGPFEQLINLSLSLLSEVDTTGLLPKVASGRYVDRNVQNNQLYYYTVVSRDYAGNNSEYGEIIPAQPFDNSRPAAPKNVFANPIDLGVKLTWDIDTTNTIAGNKIFRSENPDSLFVELIDSLIPSNIGEYNDYTLKFGQQVYYKVVAVGQNGIQSIPSARASTYYQNNHPPIAPAKPTAESLPNGTISLSWTANGESDIRGYYISRSVFKDGEKTQISELISPDNLNFVDSSKYLSSRSHYWYFVQALNYSAFTSNYSIPVYAKPIGEIVPVAPYTFHGSQHLSNIRLIWDTPLDPYITGIQIYRSENKKPFVWKLVGDSLIPINITSFLDTTITKAQSYIYHARSITFDGVQSMPSRPTTIHMHIATPLPPPMLRIVQTESGLKIIWSGALKNGIKQFLIYKRSDMETSNLIPVDSPGGSIEEFLDTDVSVGTRYTYSVSSVNTSGKEGLRSLEVEFLYE